MRLPGGTVWPDDYRAQVRVTLDGASGEYRYGRGRWAPLVPIDDPKTGTVRLVIPRADHPITRAWEAISDHADLAGNPDHRRAVLSWLVLASPIDDWGMLDGILARLREILNEINRMDDERDLLLEVGRMADRVRALERAVADDARGAYSATPPTVEVD